MGSDPQTLTSTLLNLGLPGLCILALGYVVRYLMQRSDAREEKLAQKLEAEHAARLADQKANQTVLLEAHDRVHEAVTLLSKQLDRTRRD